MKQQKFMLHQLILFIIVFLLGLLLVFTIGKCFFMNGIKVEAHNKNQKYFTTIEIEEGEEATVVVRVPEDATGTVTYYVNGKKVYYKKYV